MQRPTGTNLRIRSISDALKLFHAVRLGLLPMVTRRLDADERAALSPGCVYVWEERAPHAEASAAGFMGIERFTEGRRWGPSRVRDDFLFYYEKVDATDAGLYSLHLAPDEHDVNGAARMMRRKKAHPPNVGSSSSSLYSPYPSTSSRSTSGTPPPSLKPTQQLVKQTYSVLVEQPNGQRKWHLNAYFTQDTVDLLQTVDDLAGIGTLSVPSNVYKRARTAKQRNRNTHSIPSSSSTLVLSPSDPTSSYPTYLPPPPSSQAMPSYAPRTVTHTTITPLKPSEREDRVVVPPPPPFQPPPLPPHHSTTTMIAPTPLKFFPHPNSLSYRPPSPELTPPPTLPCILPPIHQHTPPTFAAGTGHGGLSLAPLDFLQGIRHDRTSADADILGRFRAS